MQIWYWYHSMWLIFTILFNCIINIMFFLSVCFIWPYLQMESLQWSLHNFMPPCCLVTLREELCMLPVAVLRVAVAMACWLIGLPYESECVGACSLLPCTFVLCHRKCSSISPFISLSLSRWEAPHRLLAGGVLQFCAGALTRPNPHLIYPYWPAYCNLLADYVIVFSIEGRPCCLAWRLLLGEKPR